MQGGHDDQEFCSDIIFEILSRTTSLDTLETCKSVSKKWKQIIYEPSFMPVYCKRTNNLSGYIIHACRKDHYKRVSLLFATLDDQSKKLDDCMKNTWPDDMSILCSSNHGILCCRRKEALYHYRYYTTKPATGQWQPLPNPKLRYRTIGVAIMVLAVKSSSLRYKIVRLSSPEKYCRIARKKKFICEIFDSEIWSWREVEINAELQPLLDDLIIRKSSVSIGNSVYWQTNDESVLAFNGSDESFHIIPFPDEVKNNKYKYKVQLVEYQDKVGLTCLTQDYNTLQLWLINNNNYWTKKISLNIQKLRKSVKFQRPVGFYNGEIVVMGGDFDEEIVFYNLQDCSFIRVDLDRRHFSCWDDIFQFRSDFEPVDLSGGRIFK